MSEDINVTDGTVLESLNNKVDLDGGNYIGSGLEDVVEQTHWSKKITNCITEIPQRIKLELNNGTLTLKAGSVVTIPNGFESDGTTPKFDYVTVESDVDMPAGSTTAGQRMCWLTLPNGSGNGVVRYCFSGNSSVMNSTTPNNYSTFYNTETNKMYRGNGTVWEEKPYSLPVCLATNDTTTAFTSIDQVFNGMGYIGSTIWVDKGVKGLVANGRNKDGTLKNLEWQVLQTQTLTTTNTAAKTLGLYFNEDGSVTGWSQGVYRQSIKTLTDRPTNWSGGYWIYVEDENKIYVNQNTAPSNVLMIADMTVTSTAITSLNVNNTFRAVDYQDVVKKFGDTMTGDLTISKSEASVINVQNLNLDYTLTAAPSSTIYTGGVNCYDKNNNLTGSFRNRFHNGGTFQTQMLVRRNINGTNYEQNLSVGIYPDGTSSFVFPKCTTKPSTTSSAKSDLVAVVVENYFKDGSWYRVWSDGWKEQGGETTILGNTSTTLTLLKAFTNTMYFATASWTKTMHNEAITVKSRTTSKLELDCGSNIQDTACWYACGY